MELIETKYKQTEVGLIPEEWDVKSIADIVDIDTENLSSSTNPEYLFKYISLEDVDNGILKNISELRFKEAPSRARRKLRLGDILVSTVRPNLKSHLLISDNVTDWICSTGFSVLRPRKNIDSIFLYNHFFASIINKQIENLITGSNYPAINSKEVKSLQVPIPPTLEEQKAIATVLSDVDALIANLEKLINKKKAIKQGAMQQLLTPPNKGGKRLAGFTGEWVEKRLGEIVSLEKGEQVNRDTLSIDGSYPVINGGIEPSGYSESWNRTENTITISEGGNSCGFVNFLETKFWSGGHCYTLKLKSFDVCFNFIYTLLKFNEPMIMALRVGSGLPNIQKGRLETFICSLPKNKDEQKAIAQILLDINTEIEQLETKKAKYQDIRQGMMQELLTGKTRLV